MSDSPIDFYAAYNEFKDYRPPSLAKKQMLRFDREIAGPLGLGPGDSVLEIGCGTGLFLAYLKARGIEKFLGIDQDCKIAEILPAELKPHFRAVDLSAFLEEPAGETYRAIVLLDVLEHFSAETGAGILKNLRKRAAPGARLLVKLPNCASPWGWQYQAGDHTHRCAYTPGSLRQSAQIAGWRVIAAYPHEQGSRSRRILDRLFHGLVGRLIMNPPEIWSANFYALLEPAP